MRLAECEKRLDDKIKELKELKKELSEMVDKIEKEQS